MKIRIKKDLTKVQKVTGKKIVDYLLENRDIKDKHEFTHPQPPTDIDLIRIRRVFKSRLEKVFRTLEKIKKEGRLIVVYTDYDADGITGGAILWETLYILGFKVMPYVPDRKSEGYGFSVKGIDKVKKLYNPALIISVDHGITAHEKIIYAKSLGIDVVVTDHHLRSETAPKQALAVFHIPELSGAGVSYFFAKDIFDYFVKKTPQAAIYKNYFTSDYLAFAAIGGIADLIPLTGINRSLVKFGLAALNTTGRIGLVHILKEAGIYGKKITPYEVGFVIAPRINAVGRLEKAIDALRLLCTKKEDRAYQLAEHIGKKNQLRQDLVKQAFDQAKKIVDGYGKIPKIIILYPPPSQVWDEGIIGLIAAKITETYYRPTLVLTPIDGYYKGSGRSIASFHITDFLRDLNLLKEVGGHRQAVGFTLEGSIFDRFVKKINQQTDKTLTEKDLEKTIEADFKIDPNMITLDLVKEMEKLQPFGIGNPTPSFYSKVTVNGAEIFGKNNNHLKIRAGQLELIAFGEADRYLELSRGKQIGAVYNVEIDRWAGKEKLRGKISHWTT